MIFQDIFHPFFKYKKENEEKWYKSFIILLFLYFILIFSLFFVTLFFAISSIKKEYSHAIIFEPIITNKEKNSDYEEISFYYNEHKYKAIYSNETWTIDDSYKIKNHDDIFIICNKLNEIKKIPNCRKDGDRTVDSLVKEWETHNIAYEWFSYFDYLNEFDYAKNRAKTVDLDYRDDEKDLFQIVFDRLIVQKELKKL